MVREESRGIIHSIKFVFSLFYVLSMTISYLKYLFLGTYLRLKDAYWLTQYTELKDYTFSPNQFLPVWLSALPH